MIFHTAYFSPPTQPSCAATLRQACNAGPQWPQFSATTFQQFTLGNSSQPERTSPLPQPTTDIAFFMLLRGPYWFLGYGWVGCSVPYDYPDALAVDYGEPLGYCSESAPNSGVFTRPWSKATVQVDCNTGEGTLQLL